MNSSSAVLAVSMSLLVLSAAPQGNYAQHNSMYSGTWTATVGESQILHGRWIGQTIPDDPTSAHGSWTMTGPGGKTAMTGTWSARKTAKGWHGTWSAKAATGSAAAGTWNAALASDPQATLQEFFQRLSNQTVDGTWRSRRLEGSWRLKGKPNLSAR
ncbi:MAG: hypothetical protein HY508_11610 [Acidobacteria bacterium]|nr:hypothetical protein [Acidobacteriota bacterium]